MSWPNAYIGTPYADLGRATSGCDCWGLARLVYGDKLGIPLPSYGGDYVSAGEIREIDRLIGKETATPTWTKVDDARPFDLLVFRQGRYGSHIGIQIERDLMLHMAEEDQAKVARYSEPRWSTRLVGIYRHLKCSSKGAL